jgi:hypothetical protein
LWQLRQLPAHEGSISCQVLHRGQRTDMDVADVIVSGIWHFVQFGPVFLSIGFLLRTGRLSGIDSDALCQFASYGYFNMLLADNYRPFRNIFLHLNQRAFANSKSQGLPLYVIVRRARDYEPISVLCFSQCSHFIVQNPLQLFRLKNRLRLSAQLPTVGA